MKVLHIINGVSGGGAERLINDWVAVEKKIEIDVLSILPLPGKFADNANYYSLNSKSVYNPLVVVKMLPYVRKYDLIHVSLFPSQLYVSILSYFFRDKIFLTTEHSTVNRRRSKKIFSFIDRFIYKRYASIVCISEATQTSLLSYLNGEYPVTVIHNGVHLQNIKESKAYSKSQFFDDDNIILIGMVSSFTPQKDQLTVLKALKCLDEKYRLVFVGDGMQKQQCEDFVVENKLCTQVKFLGFRDDAYSIMKACDIIVQSSVWEGFGLTVVEANACGKKVIATDVEGLNSVVSNKKLLFNVGDVEQLYHLSYSNDYRYLQIYY